MQLKKLLEKWDLTSLKIRTPFLEMQRDPQGRGQDRRLGALHRADHARRRKGSIRRKATRRRR
jgi:hypothetical protein